MDPNIGALAELRTSQLVSASGLISGSRTPAVLTPSNGPFDLSASIWTKFQIKHADVVAAGTNPLTLFTLPKRGAIARLLVEVVTAATGLTNFTMNIGYGAGYDEFIALPSGTDLGTAGTVWGLDPQDLSNALNGGKMAAPSLTAATVVKALFGTTDIGKTPADVVGCDLNIFIEALVLP